jgi:hypothetical protein
LRISNFKRNYGSAFRSLDDVKHRLDSIKRKNEGNNGGHTRRNNYLIRINEENGEEEYLSPYDDVKLPSLEFITVLWIENPSLSEDQIAENVKNRIDMRHYFPNKFKSAALASGEVYIPDEMEEYREDRLDAIELERLRR